MDITPACSPAASMTRTCGAVISSLRRVSLPVAMWVSSRQLMENSEFLRIAAAQGCAAISTI
jgi:hypothetical protein